MDDIRDISAGRASESRQIVSGIGGKEKGESY